METRRVFYFVHTYFDALFHVLDKNSKISIAIRHFANDSQYYHTTAALLYLFRPLFGADVSSSSLFKPSTLKPLKWSLQFAILMNISESEDVSHPSC